MAVKYMANNTKYLDYFPFSVNFFTDRKIRRLQRSYAADGLLIYIYLITEIYRNGSYYLEWDEEYPGDITDDLSLEITPNEVKQIVAECATRFGLFDAELFEKGIITSKGIQHRLLIIREQASKRPVNPSKLFPKYCLLSDCISDNCGENVANAEILPQTTANDRKQSQESDNAVNCDDLRDNTEDCGKMRPKEKKSKEKESKENNNTLQISNDGNLQPAAKEQNAEPAEPKTKKFVKPTIEELTGYVMATGLPLNFDDVNEFMDYYTSKGWKVGREGMKDWQAALRNWSRRKGEYSRPSNTRPTETVTITDRQRINEEFLNGK